MTQHNIEKYLFDVIVSITSIEEYISGINFEKYQESKLLRRAVEREIEIIGEAINNMLKKYPDLEISNARRIVDARNWVIHSYDSVDDVIIWGIVSKHLPLLKKEVEELLKSSNNKG